MTEFKIHVERIVRPILGSEWRTKKMREELMAHLQAAHETAVANGVSDPIAYAIQQLGDPDTLREELQDSVPRSEKYEGGKWLKGFFESVQAVFEPESEFPLKLALATSGQFILICLSILVPLGMLGFIGANLVFKGTVAWMAGLQLLGILVFIMVACGVSLFVGLYLLRKAGLHRAVHVTSSLPSIVKGSIATILCLGIVGLFLTILVAVEEQWPIDQIHIMLWEFLVILAKQPVFYAIVATHLAVTTYAIHRERRHHNEWGSLEIDD